MRNIGLCIGGPLDGKTVAYEGEHYHFDKSPESLDFYKPITSREEMLEYRAERLTYYFTSMKYFHHDEHREFGFWVLGDMNLKGAMEAMLARYQEPRKHLALLKRCFELLRTLVPFARGHLEMREGVELMQEIDKEIYE